ncbi:hypothetical protein GOP47_0023754 [Adiantum capillus-veneris]|uniref:Uncharacterized protein n=1 Tax=Adiantum capillus-veneris TaxID=13818 RepID=A0A9D4U421_ADICA|nr:hypothetical protein GOP47_0023754 [Adiantum capillus-veneris]
MPLWKLNIFLAPLWSLHCALLTTHYLMNAQILVPLMPTAVALSKLSTQKRAGIPRHSSCNLIKITFANFCSS